MKKLIALAYMLPLAVAAQDHGKACDVFSKVDHVLQEAHLKPKPADDSLSVYVFDAIIENLDENSTLLLQEDYNRLAQHRFMIDNYLKAKECAFLGDFITVYRKALERNKSYIEELSKEDLVYNTKDTIHYSRKSFPHHTDPEKIKKFLRKKMAYDVMEDIAKLSKNKDSLKVHLGKLGPESKANVVETYLCKVNSLLNPSEGFEESFYNMFFSTYCSYFDPHSTYFSYNDKASFMSSIATENYSLGLYVSQNEKEEIIIEEVVPGGPAYKTRISKGDQLIKLAANDQEYAVTCASMETISNIVLSDTYRNVELTLRKKDGTIYSVQLEKKIMKAEDHSVYSYVLGNTTPIGYIKVPSFYTALDDNSSKGCADDVAQEVENLRMQGIKGLIIDLQYNGGGSMDEVIRMAGLFIDSGPMAVITDKGKSYEVIKDHKRGTIYNGPMVVLVNGFSASASEFFAMVMQDYNRALIAGSNTLGKATMQTILPLEGSEKEFVKVTIDKFYRVTGQSSQYSGVTPDVKMPTFFEKLLPRESSMPNAIKNDSIDINVKFRQLPDDLIKQAAELSRKRIEGDTDFKLISSINSRINDLYIADKPALPVTFDNVFANAHAMDDIWADINAASGKEHDFKVANTVPLPAEVPTDDFFTSINDQKIKALKADAGVAEAIRIATDLYNLKYNKLTAASN